MAARNVVFTNGKFRSTASPATSVLTLPMSPVKQASRLDLAPRNTTTSSLSANAANTYAMETASLPYTGGAILPWPSD
jgi:hypothetical protein